MFPSVLTVILSKTTSGTHTLHIAQLDSGPGFPELVENIHAEYGMDTRMPVPSIPSDTNSDWDILYPISSFIEAEKFPIIGQALPLGEILPVIRVQLTEDVWDEALDTRNVTLKVNHEGLIYPGTSRLSSVPRLGAETDLPRPISDCVLCRCGGVVIPDCRSCGSHTSLRQSGLVSGNGRVLVPYESEEKEPRRQVEPSLGRNW